MELDSNRHEPPDGVSLLESGHILGARVLYIEDEFLYTGEAAGRERVHEQVRGQRRLGADTRDDVRRTAHNFSRLDQTVKLVNEMMQAKVATCQHLHRLELEGVWTLVDWGGFSHMKNHLCMCSSVIFEPPTSSVRGRHSTRLNYQPTRK